MCKKCMEVAWGESVKRFPGDDDYRTASRELAQILCDKLTGYEPLVVLRALTAVTTAAVNAAFAGKEGQEIGLLNAQGVVWNMGLLLPFCFNKMEDTPDRTVGNPLQIAWLKRARSEAKTVLNGLYKKP